MNETELFVGIDISQDHLDVAFGPEDQTPSSSLTPRRG